MTSGRFVTALTLLGVLSAMSPAAGQDADAVKAEIRQAIDTAYLNAYWNDMNIQAFLAGWDHGAISPSLRPTGEVTFMSVTEWIAGAVSANRKAPEKKEVKFLYPVIDVTGDMAMAKVEVMRGETLIFTDYFPVIKTKTGWKIVGYPYYVHENGARPDTPGRSDGARAPSRRTRRRTHAVPRVKKRPKR